MFEPVIGPHRFLLSALPEPVTPTLAAVTLILYVVASTVLVPIAAVSLYHWVRRSDVPIASIAVNMLVLETALVLLAVRVAAAALDPIGMARANNIAVHLLHLVLVAVTVVLPISLARFTHERLPPRLRVVHAAAVYVAIIGAAGFVLTSFNAYVRLIEAGALLSAVLTYWQMAFLQRTRRVTTRVGDVLRVFVISASVGVTVMLSAVVVRQMRLGPRWLDPVLLYPYVTIAIATALYITAARAPSLHEYVLRPTDRSDAPTQARAPSPAAFFDEAIHAFGVTPGERSVLELLMHGARTADIARRLGISEKTVRNHISSLYRRTETADRVSLVRVFEPV